MSECPETALNVKAAAGGWYGELGDKSPLRLASEQEVIRCDRGEHGDGRHHGIDPVTHKDLEWETPR